MKRDLSIARHGQEEFLNCLECNEKNGVVYHRTDIEGDSDDSDAVEQLISFIKTEKRAE